MPVPNVPKDLCKRLAARGAEKGRRLDEWETAEIERAIMLHYKVKEIAQEANVSRFVVMRIKRAMKHKMRPPNADAPKDR